MRRVIKSFRYLIRDEVNAANALIFSLKKDNRNDVLEFCRNEMVTAIRHSIESPEQYVFTNIPRRHAAIIEYGMDHSELLARAVARELGAEYISLLKSGSKKAQKSLEREERLKNVDFKLIKDIDLTGKSVIVVDDIITTGASVGTAAALIRSLGARSITAATLAIAYKDKYESITFV